MINRTYRNVMRTIKMIQDKGYDFEESKIMALKKWDEYDMYTPEQKRNIGYIDRFINMIVRKDEFETL